MSSLLSSFLSLRFHIVCWFKLLQSPFHLLETINKSIKHQKKQMVSYVFICFLSPSYTKILTSRFSTPVFLPAPCNSKRRRELGKGGSVGRYTSARHSTWGLRSTREKWGVFLGASTREKNQEIPRRLGVGPIGGL